MSRIAIQWCEIGDLDIHIADGNYSSKYPRSEEFLESGIPFIRANNLLDKSVSDKDMYFISPQKHNLLKKGHLKKNDVLVTTRGDLGKVALVPERHDDSNINAQLVLLRPNPQKVDPLFLLYCFEGSQVKGQVNQLQTGTALQQLPVGNLKKIKIPVPPIAEQRRIAAILDKADAIRRKRKQAIQYTEELLRATFLEFMKEVSDVCQKKSLKEITLNERNSFVNGPFGSNLLTSELQSEGVPVVYIRDIREGVYKRVSEAYVAPEKAEELNTCNVVPGDVLIAKVGDPPGKAAIYPALEPQAIVTQDVVRMRLDPTLVNSEFVVAYINSSIGKHSLSSIIVEATRSRFSLGEFKSLVVDIPPLAEQNEFSNQYNQIRLIQERLQNIFLAEDNLFNSLLQRAFQRELSA